VLALLDEPLLSTPLDAVPGIAFDGQRLSAPPCHGQTRAAERVDFL
jgi:hypothetical protein